MAAPLVLVDGSSYLYRAFHALPPLTGPKGQPTGAVVGVTHMLRRLLDETKASRIAVVFDAKGPTFRDEIFKEYKAHRPPMPDELRSQVEPLLALTRALGFPVLQVSGVEADDVIGTLAAREPGPVLISTGDKDMAQLVDARVTLVNTMSGTTLDRAGVKAKFDVFPEQIVDLLALMGDASDNIPGVTGWGPKTAAKYLNQFGTLEQLLAHADEVPGKVGEKLRASIAEVTLSKDLARIRCDVELPALELARGTPDRAAIETLCAELGFSSLLRSLDGPAKRAAAPAAPSPAAGTAAVPAASIPDRVVRRYATVLTEAELERWIGRLGRVELFAFDTETTSLDYMKAEIVGLSFAVDAGEAAYVPLAHAYLDAPAQLDRSTVLAALKPLLEDPARPKVGHNLKYDAHVLANHGIALAGLAHDTMLESYVLDAAANRHDMDTLALRELDLTTIKYEDVAGKGAKQLPFAEVPVPRAAEYAAEDADVTLRLHRKMFPRLAAEPPLAELYRELEMPLLPVLLRMERDGVLIDSALLRKQSAELGERMAELEREAHRLAGREFNINSPKQLGQILFEEAKLPVLRKTPTGQPSTAEDVLEELAAEHALPRAIIDHRGLSKLKSTYTDTLPELVHPRTGRVHTSYHQAVAVTGRLSSADPNLQNIPIRTAEGRRIRQAFVAPPGQVLLAADYSQIELRIMAHLSQDAGLLEAFAADRDVHQATAAEVFDVELEAVSDDQRRAAKAINFGLIYGMSAHGLSRQLDISRTDAQKYVDLYFDRYPGVKRYMDQIRMTAREQGAVSTVFGRKLRLPEIESRNPMLRGYAERTAINAPMQGSAADIIKRAMLEVQRWLDASGTRARMIMQVHDELVFEVDVRDLDTVRREVPRLMSGAATLAVPLKVDVGVGANWDEAH
jgi:DNA polymerase-1